MDGERDDVAAAAAGWQLARRGIHLALNNEVEEAQEMLRAEAEGNGCPQAQAGFCFIAFMVSTDKCVGAAHLWLGGYRSQSLDYSEFKLPAAA